MNANNQNQKKNEEPHTPKYFRPWKTNNEQNAARPNATVPLPVVSLIPLYYWCLPYTFVVAAQPLPAICPDGATTVSTPQPLLWNEQAVPTMEAAAPQIARNEPTRKYEVVGENKEKLMKKIAQLSREQAERIIPYRREMARTFPAKERTPAEQRKRDKNTEACRLSRRRKKLQEIDLLWPKLSKYGKAKCCELFGDYLHQ